MTAVAIDDEPIALEVIRTHAEKVPFLDLTATFVSATEAITYLQQHPADVVFLDIRMPDISGIDMIPLIGSQTKIIFTTAYPEFAVKGFELAVLDYLLKPINLNRFLQACTRAHEQLLHKTTSAQPANLLVKDGSSWVSVNLNTLLFIEANDNYLVFNEPGRQTMARMTLQEVLQKLPKNQFIRIHKSYIVSIARIERIEKNYLLLAGKQIPLSDTYRNLLLQRFTLQPIPGQTNDNQ